MIHDRAMTTRMRSTLLAASLLLMVAAACSGTTGVSPAPRAGSEGGPCPPHGTSCDVDLVCLSNLCVRPEPATGAGTGPDGSVSIVDGASGASDTGVDASVVDAGADGPRDAGLAADAGCKFGHPLLDAGARYCAAGHCYCKPADSCYPMAIASLCCTVPVTCY